MTPAGALSRSSGHPRSPLTSFDLLLDQRCTIDRDRRSLALSPIARLLIRRQADLGNVTEADSEEAEHAAAADGCLRRASS